MRRKKEQIAHILLFAVSAQAAQFIGGYHGYPLPATIPAQDFALRASNFYAYPIQPSNYYRDIGSWAYFIPTVQVDANALQPGAIVDPKSSASPVRTKRQIQLRYRGGSRRGRSVNKLPSFQAYDKFGDASTRTKRQNILRYRYSSRRRVGRSLNEPSFTGSMPTHWHCLSQEGPFRIWNEHLRTSHQAIFNSRCV